MKIHKKKSRITQLFPYFARPEYLPSAVETRIISSCEMNNGTLISNPDSNTAFLLADVAVSPFTAGSHSTTCRATLSGK